MTKQSIMLQLLTQIKREFNIGEPRFPHLKLKVSDISPKPIIVAITAVSVMITLVLNIMIKDPKNKATADTRLPILWFID